MSAQDDQRLGPADEYKSLREELHLSRRYVFERPLLIAALGFAAVQEIEGNALLAAFPLLAALLFFNFWFTVNRLGSAARISGYIQLVLEERARSWCGWETSLRKYRFWQQEDKKKTKKEKKNEKKRKSEAVDKILSERQTGDALRFYPAILLLHVFLMAATIAASGAAAVAWPGPVSNGSGILTLTIAACFFIHCYKWKWNRMETSIERERIIWELVLSPTNAMTPAAALTPADALNQTNVLDSTDGRLEQQSQPALAKN